MDKQYNELNEFLDQCINDALQETAGKFQVGIDNSKGVDNEDYKKSDRFTGFKEEVDIEGEKMKDYEKPPPYKIYQRPLSSEETKSFKQYEQDMSNMKPGKRKPAWNGFDDSLRGYDKTEEYSSVKPRGKPSNSKGTGRDYRETDQKQDSTRKSSSKEDVTYPSEQTGWSYRNDFKGPQSVYNVKEPKINPNIYHPPKESSKYPDLDRWLLKNKFSKNKENTKTGYPDTTTSEKSRRYSEPTPSKYDSTDELEPKVEVKGSKEDKGKAEETVKEKALAGMKEEEVKQELLKLRPVILDRASWGALPPMRDVKPMEPPADTVVFTLNTGTSPCLTEDDCRRTVREIQARHMGKGLEDIQYNFLVGGDGNLYEGRGWGFESGIKPEKQQGKNYNIAFIGDFQGDIEKIPPQMLGPVQELIIWGNAIRLMSKDTKTAGEYRFHTKTE